MDEPVDDTLITGHRLAPLENPADQSTETRSDGRANLYDLARDLPTDPRALCSDLD